MAACTLGDHERGSKFGYGGELALGKCITKGLELELLGTFTDFVVRKSDFPDSADSQPSNARADNNTDEGREINRRVELKVMDAAANLAPVETETVPTSGAMDTSSPTAGTVPAASTDSSSENATPAADSSSGPSAALTDALANARGNSSPDSAGTAPSDAEGTANDARARRHLSRTAML